MCDIKMSTDLFIIQLVHTVACLEYIIHIILQFND